MTAVLDKASQLLTPKKNQEFFFGFLPQVTKEFFDDSPGVNKDNKIKQSTAGNYEITGTIDTSLIDQFRQGVEITRARHFFAGSSPRIHAGEPGHVLKKNFYGADRNFLKQNYYQELNYYNPVQYLLSHESITYPIVTHDTDETENYNFNGVIEPLTIRAVAALFSIDVPFEAHSIKGMMMDGNHEVGMSSSRILTVFRKKEKYKLPAWLDLIDMMGTVKKIPTIGFFNDEKAYLDPFNDASNKLQLFVNLPNDMSQAIINLQGSTDNYIDDLEISATCGWTYDDVWSKGTDSIAFGGFAH